MESYLKLNLTPEENNELNKIIGLFPTNPVQIDRTLTYYLEYKANTGNVLMFIIKVPSHQILLAFKCAFFMAEKSEVLENLKVPYYLWQG